MEPAITAAIIAVTGTVVGAILALLGKKEEVSGTATSKLIDQMESRLQGYEVRLDKAEGRIDKLTTRVRLFQSHNDALRRALANALEWIADAVEWMNGDREALPPAPPDSAAWHELIRGVSQDLEVDQQTNSKHGY